MTNEFGFEMPLVSDEEEKLLQRVYDKDEKLSYAKTIIKDLLDNSDEYARQRAIDFLEEVDYV